MLEGTPPFDPLQARAFPEVGYLAEAFRRRPDTMVTDNPSGRFGARGRRASELSADAPWDNYYGPGSPLGRLCRHGGLEAEDLATFGAGWMTARFSART